MTEKIARRGVRVPAEYEADFLDQIGVADVCSKGIVAIRGNQLLAEVRQWIESAAPGTTHQGFPVLNENGHLVGVLTRRDLLNAQTPGGTIIESMIRRRPSFVYDDCTLRDAADHMVRHEVGRLPVVSRKETWKVIGMITDAERYYRAQHRRRISDAMNRERSCH